MEERFFEMMRILKSVLPTEKAGRVFCENDGHLPKILLRNNVDATNPSNAKLTEKEIERIKKISFVEDVVKNEHSDEELWVRVKAK